MLVFAEEGEGFSCGDGGEAEGEESGGELHDREGTQCKSVWGCFRGMDASSLMMDDMGRDVASMDSRQARDNKSWHSPAPRPHHMAGQELPNRIVFPLMHLPNHSQTPGNLR